ncbi:MAG TPA: hypothetical protein VD902_15045, partial [Symbiobacteriaceae bacterium]|nr:hypothetical protein [Symbiobacteriaceae bacterium]
QTPSGQPCIMAGNGGQAFGLPPEIPGMPRFPGPPEGLLGGGPVGGGLYQPIAPVAPFDSGNQVRRYQQQ